MFAAFGGGGGALFRTLRIKWDFIHIFVSHYFKIPWRESALHFITFVGRVWGSPIGGYEDF
jgi:hypothetical protein